MCGIVSYIGNKDPVPILIKGLRRLEYRGYDSAGLALLDDNNLSSLKKAGKVSELSDQISSNPIKGSCGIAHTRWATHGIPNDLNAHPHLDKTGKIALVHNGIIENYDPIKKTLESRGVVFKSETDSEVLVQLISEIYNNGDLKLDFKDSVKAALQEVVGAYGIVALCSDEPNTLVAARMGSPLVFGVGDNEYSGRPLVFSNRGEVEMIEGLAEAYNAMDVESFTEFFAEEVEFKSYDGKTYNYKKSDLSQAFKQYKSIDWKLISIVPLKILNTDAASGAMVLSTETRVLKNGKK